MSVISNHIEDIQMIEGLSDDMRVRANVMHQEMRRANNQLVLLFKLFRNFSLSANHSIIFNNKTVADIKKINTLMMFGIRYQFQNNKRK